MRSASTYLLLSLLLIQSCSEKGNLSVDFDGQAAYRYLQTQCDLGPRVPNTPAHKAAQEMLSSHFKSLGAEVEEQSYALKDPYSPDTLRLTNIIARFSPSRANRLLFCAHWDSRPRCDRDPDPSKRDQPLPGANDGASGVAVLMQLAEHLAQLELNRGIDIVLFDGEDWGREGDLEHYLLGSQYFARHVDPARYDYCVLLDLVGDKEQILYKEGFSARFQPRLVDQIWKRARELGLAGFAHDKIANPVHDDHIPLLAAGIKAVNIIDFDYRWWHTIGDTPDKCSPESLDQVGTLLLSLVVEPL